MEQPAVDEQNQVVCRIEANLSNMRIHDLALAYGKAEIANDEYAQGMLQGVIHDRMAGLSEDENGRELAKLVPQIITRYLRIEDAKRRDSDQLDESITTSFEPPFKLDELEVAAQPELAAEPEVVAEPIPTPILQISKVGIYISKVGNRRALMIGRVGEQIQPEGVLSPTSNDLEPATTSPDDTISRLPVFNAHIPPSKVTQKPNLD